jgi:NAD(P)-dependent dehydrogenase (short-subunit alcohol dehydrogenase family)
MPKTVLITGTSSGVGEATARLFLAKGWSVVATARDPEKAVPGETNSELLRARLDVTDPASIASVFQAATTRFGAVDVVVNNAGVGLGGPLEGVTTAQLREHFETNVIGVAAVCQVAAGHMRPRHEGVIINVTSLTGRVGVPFLAPYCASKFAVEGMTEALYYELRPFGLRVKLIEPGGTKTRFSHVWASHPAYLAASDQVFQTMIQGGAKAAPPEQVAKVILTAATSNNDRLRYAATDAVAALRAHRVLSEGAWRKVMAKGFGLGA